MEDIKERINRIDAIAKESQALIERILERIDNLETGESCDEILTKKDIKKMLHLSEKSFQKYKEYLISYGMNIREANGGTKNIYTMRKSDLLKVSI